jgi:signal transduction histidine kinase
MDDAAAPDSWLALLALVKHLGPYDGVALDRDLADGAPIPDGWQTVEIPRADGRPGGRLRLQGGPRLSPDATAALRHLATSLTTQEQQHAFMQLLGRHVVHDLRTPVTIIQGYGDLLRSGKVPAGTVPLQAIVDQTARLLAILKDFALASGTQVPGQRVCPGAALPPALAHLGHVDLPPDLPQVAVDAELLADITRRLQALARQMASPQAPLAVSATPAGAMVSLNIHCDQPVPLIEVAQAALSGIPPNGPHARVPWLMPLIALQQLVTSQGGRLAIQQEDGRVCWRCDLPTACPETQPWPDAG